MYLTPTWSLLSEDKLNANPALAKDVQRPTGEKLNRLKTKLHQMLLQGVKARNHVSSACDSDLGILFGHNDEKVIVTVLTPAIQHTIDISCEKLHS